MNQSKAKGRRRGEGEPVDGAKRAVVIDDHPLIRQALRETIDRHVPEVEVVGEASGQNEAAALLRELAPDLAIVDLTLRQGHGIELIKQVRHVMPEMRVLVLSLHDESTYAERAIRAGANGYVSKNADPAVLVDAIRRVLEGKTFLSDRMMESVVGHIAGPGGQGAASIDDLSDRELEVFELLGRGLSTRQIAEQMNLSMKTVDVYRQRVKAKLGVDSSSELTRRAVCYVLERQ